MKPKQQQQRARSSITPNVQHWREASELALINVLKSAINFIEDLLAWLDFQLTLIITETTRQRYQAGAAVVCALRTALPPMPTRMQLVYRAVIALAGEANAHANANVKSVSGKSSKQLARRRNARTHLPRYTSMLTKQFKAIK